MESSETSDVSAADSQAPVFRSVPEGEEATVAFGVILSVSSNSITVELASADEAESPDAGGLRTTGIQQTVLVDAKCPILGADGEILELNDLKKGMAVQFSETPSMLLSIQVLPAADESGESLS